MKFLYRSSTVIEDPTTGYLRFDSNTFASITEMAISDQDTNNNNIHDLIESFEDNTSSILGQLRVQKATPSTDFCTFRVTGLTGHGTGG